MRTNSSRFMLFYFNVELRARPPRHFHLFDCVSEYAWSRGSSVSIVSGYGLDDWDRGSIPAEAREFFSNLCIQTGSGAHPASCTMGTGGKARQGRDADHSPKSSAKVVNE
jgi:hypothetical protein